MKHVLGRVVGCLMVLTASAAAPIPANALDAPFDAIIGMSPGEVFALGFNAYKRGEKVEVEVPVTLTGEPAPGTMHIQDADVLLVEADVLNIPEEIEVSIEGLEDGAVITAGDVTMPEDTTLVAEEDTVIVSISLPEVDEELEEAAEAAEEGGADAGAESAEDSEESADSDEE